MAIDPSTDERDLPSRDRLVRAAARLFRQKGYHGVGLSEILAETGLPKGSLYHHFPKGKPDLARAAAELAGAVMLGIIDDAFAAAGDYDDGVATLCHKLAKFFDISGRQDGCPVSAVLFEDPENTGFRDLTDRIFRSWIERAAAHGRRLGLPDAEASDRAETLLIALEGGWALARARRSSEVLRSLPRRLA